MKVLLTGGTGFVGSKIAERLLNEGHKVVILTRNVPKAVMKLGRDFEYFKWEPAEEEAPLEAFNGVEAVINLVGENISEGRWDERQKKRIYDSRILSTKHLVATLNKTDVKTFISTSAIGIYGDRPESEEVTEETKVKPVDFLSRLCIDWEKEALKVNSNVRLCILRVGIVLEKNGGAIKKMLFPFKMGVGGVMGSGNQVMSWIHLKDLVSLYNTCLTDEKYKGVVNATAPRPVTNRVFTNTFGKVIKRPTILPMPGFAAELAFGEMSVILLEGQKVVPHQALGNSFEFQFDTIQKALADIL